MVDEHSDIPEKVELEPAVKVDKKKRLAKKLTDAEIEPRYQEHLKRIGGK